MIRYALPELRLEALEKEVRLWLRLDADISKRLKLPHGWTPAEIQVHQADLKEREALRERLHEMVARQPDQPNGAP